jgi:glucose/arabinose dehydrogenase
MGPARRWNLDLIAGVFGVLLFFSASAASGQAVQGLDAITVVSGLTNPVFVTAPPGDFGRLFIIEQNVSNVGQIRILNLQTGLLNSKPFLTVSGIATGGEQGLLGLAFDPDYAANGKFYLHYVANVGAGEIRVRQYQVSAADADLADTTATTIKSIVTFSHPQGNHNAGWIGFSPRANDDHNFYISSGDGGNGDDAGTGHHEPGGNAQWNQTLLGKMLRIHVDPSTGTPSIPSDNPFAGSSDPLVKKEIWLMGLRNPYRDSFDRATGRMFIGDVGQNTREEIDVQESANPSGGENYGWRDREGKIQNPTYATATPTPTPIPPRVDPIFDYPRPSVGAPTMISGRTVVGGYVYRGKQIPQLRGTYVFADYLGPSDAPGTRIFTLNYDGTSASNPQDVTAQLFPTVDPTPVGLLNPSSLGEDANGELYITDISAGRVYKIVPSIPNVKIDSIVSDLVSGHIVLRGTGVPFKKHSVQATNDLTLWPPGKIADVMALGDGTFAFDDGTPPSPRFYRVVYPALP